jgi:hypothetical protein
MTTLRFSMTLRWLKQGSNNPFMYRLMSFSEYICWQYVWHACPLQIVKHFIEPTLYDKVKFVYSNNSYSQRILADMFDLDKLEFAFGGRNTTSLDITKYSKRMRRRDQIRGACKDASGTISPSGQRIQSTTWRLKPCIYMWSPEPWKVDFPIKC